MGFLRRKASSTSLESHPAAFKNEHGPTIVADPHVAELGDHTQLHRDLKARHITMIAIGGAIGTGLIIGTGAALARAGPGAIFISYSVVGFLVYLVMCALGEMAAWLPLSSGFTGYAARFCDPALGFSLGYTYWFKYIIVTPNQLTAAALVLQFWVPRERVNPGVFIAVFLVVIVCINYFGVRFFGELEFWLSSIKVTVIVGLIILSLVLALGGGPDHDRKGFRYWKNPGAFATYLKTGDSGRFLALWSTMVTATFAYLGTELVGVTVGEAQNPRKTIPRAIKLTFYRILFFYVLSVLLVGMLVPYNSQELLFATKANSAGSSTASASPFVVAIVLSGIKVLPGILNGCILIFVFSAANSDLYIASRTIYGLAVEGKAPRILARTDRRGVPVYALGLSTLFALLAFLNVSDDSRVVFGYFVNLVTIFGLLTWISILVSHIYFVRARRAQGVADHQLAFRAPFGVAGSYGALAFCILIAIFKNFNVFVHSPTTYGNFDYKNFITAYLGIPLYLIMIFGYKLWTRSHGVTPHTADLFGGKQAIDDEEAEFLARKAEKDRGKKSQGGWFYRTSASTLDRSNYHGGPTQTCNVANIPSDEMPRDRTAPSAALQDYLKDVNDPRLPRHIAAEFASLPRSLLDETQGPKSRSISNMGTSMLLSSVDQTRSGTNPSHDLPALIRQMSSHSSADSRDSPNTIDPLIPEHRWLGSDADGNLVAPAPAILQCPFNFLQCFWTFAAFEEWLSHSLKHFRQLTPPAHTKCCFCDAEFENPDGRECWAQLLHHVEAHHKRGEQLADVPPNLSLIEYLHKKRLIDDAEYRFLKTRGGRPSGPFGYGSTEDSAYDLQNAPMFARSIESYSSERERRRGRRGRR